MSIERAALKLFFIFSALSFSIHSAGAIPPLTPYEPGQTLNPGCAPESANCSVISPVNTGNFGIPFYNFMSATSTTALLEGVNLYFTNARADARFVIGLSATTSLPSVLSLPQLSYLGASSSSMTLGRTVGDVSGTVKIGLGGAGSGAPNLFVLDSKSNSGDPSGINGAMYYNANSHKLRCYENGSWSNCLATTTDMQSAASYDTSDALTNIGSATTTITSLSITPLSATGDVYVRAKTSIVSSNATDQNLILAVKDTSNCTGTALVTRALTITAGSGNEVGDFEISYVDVDAGASAHSYSFCASTASGDTDIRLYQMFATVIDTGADIAEIYTSEDTGLEAGDVVSFDKNLKTGIEKSRNAYDGKLLGVVSTRPGMVIGSVEKEGSIALPVALSGRVPVKVNTENGSIAVGDYLTSSSIQGVAMKATAAHALVIGQALGSYSGDMQGMLMMFVKNTSLPGAAAENLCLKKSNGENVCVTAEILGNLLQNLSNGSSTSSQ